MLKRKLTASDWFLVFANLLPLYGVWFEGWDPKQMFLVYCLETIIIGGYNIVNMIIITLYRKKDVWEGAGGSKTMVRGWFFILFFIVHYGFFVFIQTAIFAGVTGLSPDGNFGPFTFLSRIFSYLSIDAKTVLYIFIAMYGFRMLFDFILSGRYRNTSLGMQMFQPYLRIFIQQFVVILGSMFLAFSAGNIFMLIFVSIKIYAEVFINFDAYLKKGEKMQKLKDMI
ncbi:MAG: hypothetical protein JWO92_534 [Chitinophagaceae bacterium]|nr:hypothetical protein [Chitinophagaceae bacterium]